MSTRRSNLLSRKVIIVVALLAIGTVSVILVASSIAKATTAQQEQQHQRTMMWSDQRILQINGSVSVANEISNFINENVNVSFVEAAQTAQGKVTNGTVLGGHLGVVQGYVVCKFFVTDTANQTGHLSIIDAGNSDVLCISEAHPLDYFGHSFIFGPWSSGEHDHGGRGGPWKALGEGLWR
jgi:hypothetical protein